MHVDSKAIRFTKGIPQVDFILSGRTSPILRRRYVKTSVAADDGMILVAFGKRKWPKLLSNTILEK